MNRFVHFIIAVTMAIMCAIIGSTGAYILTLDIQPTVAPWLWNLTFTIMMLVGLCGFIYCVLRALDEAFLPKDCRRRITGTRL